MSDQAVLRVQKEVLDIQRSPDSASFLLATNDQNVLHVHALILGPPDTPYCQGMFDFIIDCPKDYPGSPPKVVATTTSNNRVRFNPNIYANGKVCLSILGTWRGEAGEQWSSAHGLSSVLISIQSLMSDKPYHNEPGFEDKKDDKLIDAYNEKILHETLRVAICDRLEHILGLKSNEIGGVTRDFCTCRKTSPFEDVAKRHFLLHYPTYKELCEKIKSKEGSTFEKMAFEYPSNTMEGKFTVADIQNRLTKIYEKLEDEWQKGWLQASVEQNRLDTTTSSNLKSQFDQISVSNEFEGKLEFELEDNNPFVWLVVLYGPTATNHEGGLFKARMLFHRDFPDILPRVKFSTPTFHPNITPDGYPYLKSPKKSEEIKQWLESLLALFGDHDVDPNPGTHVNPEAAKLYFGDKDQRRDFNRRVRRAAQRSVDY